MNSGAQKVYVQAAAVSDGEPNFVLFTETAAALAPASREQAEGTPLTLAARFDKKISAGATA